MIAVVCTMTEAGREGLPAIPVLHVVIPVPLTSLHAADASRDAPSCEPLAA
jgi:hypothetical protein